MRNDNQKITFVLTSCARFDLLEKTLASFFQHEDAKLIDRFILTEDSGDKAVYKVLEKFPQAKFEVLLHNPPKGQMPSIDAAYKMVETPYIFHCEDDWEFTKPNFIKPSLALLEDFPEFVQVLIRDPAEEKHGSTDAPLIEHKGIKYRRPDPQTHPVWYGYSCNPGLRRTEDQKKIGSFGVLLGEPEVSLKAKELGFCQAMLENGGVKHIGQRRHVSDVFVPKLNAIRRLRKSIMKRTVGLPPDPDMSKALPISCFIVAQDEEQRIERALISVASLVNEIIVVDSGSTDSTMEIAKKYGARVIEHPWEGDGPQKRFAEAQCANKWVLNIDCDEWLDVGLMQDIRRLFEKGEPKKSVWCLRRGDIYFGDRSLRWHTNLENMPRLYDRSKTGFTPQSLHTSVPRKKGNYGVLKNGVLLHTPAGRITNMIKKEMGYAKIGMKNKSTFVLLLRFYTDFLQCFLKHYFLRNHIFGGRKGFVYSMVRAYERFLRTAMEAEKKFKWIEKETTRLMPEPLTLEEKSKITPIPVSGFIVAQNEEARIGRALHTMQKLGLDEIIVVDSGSDDKTKEIAKSFGAKVIFNKWPGFIGNQKVFAQTECSNNWIFNLDADEWLNDKAIKNIRLLFNREGGVKHPAYSIGRNDLYIGRKHIFPRMKAHQFIRLYDSRKANFKPGVVIDNIDYDPKHTGKIKGRMLHTAVKSLWHLAQKENTYTDLEQGHVEKTLPNLSWRLFLEMPLFFFKFYLLRGTIFGGLQGFVYAMIYSFSRFQRIAKLLEKNSIWAR